MMEWEKTAWGTGLSLIILGVIACIVSFAMIKTNYSSTESLQKEVISKVESGYDVYVDGQEVNPEFIDTALYNFSIDDENKRIYLTN